MFSYAPPEPGGSGFAIATDRFMGLLSAHASPELVTSLFRLLDAPDATMTGALALLADARATDRFALAEVIDRETQSVSIAVRGDVVVDLMSASTTRFSWPEGATWLTGEAHGVDSMRLALNSTSSPSAHLPLARGVVSAVETSIVLGGTHEPALDQQDAAPAPSAEVDSVATSGVAVVPAATASSDAGAHVDRKPKKLDLSSLAGAPGWTLQLPDGNELDAAPQIVVGRRPWRTDPEETSTYYIVAPSPRKEISGKHVEFAVVGNELQARDMGSTNGTLVFAQDKPPRLLHEGRAVTLDIGDTLDLGEGFRIVVGARN